jgi:hypothetical protein
VVKFVNVGSKRVGVTAYCPDDALGIACCEWLLTKISELLGDTSEEQIRADLTAINPEWAKVFEAIDAGWKLPREPELAISPSNAIEELRVVKEIMRERMEQSIPPRGAMR